MHLRARPKFPRRRRVFTLRAPSILAAAIFIGLILLILTRCVSSPKHDQAPLPNSGTTNNENSAQQPASLPMASPQKTADGITINLAGITAKQQTPANDPQPLFLHTAEPAFTASNKEISEKPATLPATTSRPIVQATNVSAAHLPRNFSETDELALFSPAANMWGQPFVGFGLDEISIILTSRYGKLQPTQWGEHLQGIVSTLKTTGQKKSKGTVALTLDACGGKKGESYDEGIINFLREKKIPATIFVTSQWISANRQIFNQLSADPLFEMAAHGVAHKPASVNGKKAYHSQGTTSIEALVTEVEGNLREIQRTTNKRPQWFRSGTAFYDEIAIKIIHELGVTIAGYSIAADEGATLSATEVASKILLVKNGDIILCHMNHPQSGTREGLKMALPKLLDKGFIFIKLSDSL